MLVSVEFADAGTKTGSHRVLVVGGCSDATAPGDIGISLEEAKTLLNAPQCPHSIRSRTRTSAVTDFLLLYGRTYPRLIPSQRMAGAI
jgi:hypothetical protein